MRELELFYDRGNHYEFLSLVQELAAPGELRSVQSFDFEFKNVEKQYESYAGINVKLRYFVRVTVSKRLSDVVKEKDIWVHSYKMPTTSESNNSIKMEVGIEDCLHIEFEYNKSKYAYTPLLRLTHRLSSGRYHLKDVIVGKIYFLLVRIKIKHMELSIIRRETTGSGSRPPNSDAAMFCSTLGLDSTKSVQRIRNDNQIRNYGRCARARCVLACTRHLLS